MNSLKLGLGLFLEADRMHLLAALFSTPLTVSRNILLDQPGQRR
jgi:hypothetical protein